MLTAGNVSDIKAAPDLLQHAGRMRYLLGDKGFDADSLRRSLRHAGATPVIPGRRNRKRAICYDKQRYRDRHLVENAFCRLKDFRRVATRYDKLAANFLSGVALATTLAFWLRTSLDSSKNVLTLAAQREAVAHLQACHGMSERPGCQFIAADRKSVRYPSTRDNYPTLREKLHELVNRRRRFGYSCLDILLRREGVMFKRNRPSGSTGKKILRSGDEASPGMFSRRGRLLQCWPCRTKDGAWTLCMTK